MDPVTQQLIESILAVNPEYSISRGWQPVDGGTISQSTNVLQDRMQLGGDVLMQILMGSFDPSSLEPIPDPSWEPEEAPVGETLLLYQNDPTMTIVTDLLKGGATPRDAVLTAKFELEGEPVDLDDKTVADEITYLTGEAAKLQAEIGEIAAFEAREQQAPMIDSPMMETFRELGIPTGSYTPEMMNPDLAPAQEAAAADEEKLNEAAKAFYDLQEGTSPAVEGRDRVRDLVQAALSQTGALTREVPSEQGERYDTAWDDLSPAAQAYRASGEAAQNVLDTLEGGGRAVLEPGRTVVEGLANTIRKGDGLQRIDDFLGNPWQPRTRGSIGDLGVADTIAATPAPSGPQLVPQMAAHQAANPPAAPRGAAPVKDWSAFNQMKEANIQRGMSDWERRKQQARANQAMSGRNLQRDWLMQTLSGLPGV